MSSRSERMMPAQIFALARETRLPFTTQCMLALDRDGHQSLEFVHKIFAVQVRPRRKRHGDASLRHIESSFDHTLFRLNHTDQVQRHILKLTLK